jgi:regulatory protein
MRMENRGDMVYRSALKSALRILARREHSVFELSQKLVHRGYEEETVRRVVAECGRLNYLDDRRAADQLIGRLQRKGLGMRRIRQELEKRGLDDHQAEARLRVRVTPADERSLACRVALKKLKSLESETYSQAKKLKLQRFLRYRGFSDSLIIEVVKEILT